MDFGIHLPHIGRLAGGPALARFASEADRLGYHSAWVSDHIAWPTDIASKYPYTDTGDFPAPQGTPWLDPLATLVYVSAVTTRIRLGTTVLILGHRPPVQTAKLIATLDTLSAGRTILGVGVGWMAEEFEVLGMPFDHRGARADEQLQLFERLFTADQPSFEGRFYRFPPIGFNPKPPQGHVPIWVGGATEAAFQRVVRYGDAFHAAFTPLPQLSKQIARVRQLATASGRDPASITVSTRCWLDFDRVMDPAKSIAGPPDAMLAQLAEYRAAGVSHVLLDPVSPGVEARVEAMSRFAAEVMPKA